MEVDKPIVIWLQVNCPPPDTHARVNWKIIRVLYTCMCAGGLVVANSDPLIKRQLIDLSLQEGA